MKDKFVNLDSAQTAYFERELESVKAKTYDVIRAPLNAFELIPVSSEAGAGAETITYRSYDHTGVAKIIADYASDLPRADVLGREYISKVRTIGNSFGYNYDEILAGEMSGRPLEARKANAAARAQRELWNRIAFYGDATNGIQGWLTNANIPSSSVPADGTASATTFASKTPIQIVRDLNAVANGIVARTKKVEIPDTLVLPIAQFNLIQSTRMSEGTDTTILKFFLDNNTYIKDVMSADELTATELAANGVTDFTGDIMIAYKRDPDKLTFEVPSPYKQLPVQEKNLEFVVPCHSRVGGTLVYYPFSMAIAEGI